VNCETTNTKTFTALKAYKNSVEVDVTSFITWTEGTLADNKNRIIVALPTKANLGTYTIKLNETNSFGTTPLETTSLTLTITCTVTSIANLVAASPFTAGSVNYTLFSGSLIIDFSDPTINSLV
jgi:hypothetical protein